ncbi:unnamed protein product [Prorocentrum cordatum]|uniref:Uncharacterized protein n=1 Tax=Prorocentrum cordatum TaxID=2364126 RepID=A0ABN9XND0_9DINO|nr:unnamed protein product [Polarella glacialis]
MHLVGAHARRNLTAALEDLSEAADLGDPGAQYTLGALHSSLLAAGPGRELSRDEALGVLYTYAASVGGHQGALMAMGYRHSQGYGVPKSCSAAALNYVEVAREVAGLYGGGMPQAVELVRLGVAGQSSKAVGSSEMAEQGDAGVAYAVGKRYMLGIEGFGQDYGEAARHLRTASGDYSWL